jgi:benzoylformate decarboxylase
VRLEAAPTPVAEHVDGAMTGHQVLEVLNDFVTDSTVYVNETTTLDVDYLSRIVIDQPGMYHFPASGGLGFGLPAAVGISLARPEATVVATVGDGSANYGITALYTAAQRGTRTVFVIVNNSTYGALRGFAARLDALNAPGLDVPGIDFVSLAAGYGVPASRTTTLEEFHSAYSAALQASGPVLIDARVAAP